MYLHAFKWFVISGRQNLFQESIVDSPMKGKQGKSERVAARVRVRGFVQGIFFRAETATAARQHGVTGWVRNLPDGGVEALFCGHPAQVEALISWCHHGPAMARVDKVEVSWEGPDETYSDFFDPLLKKTFDFHC